MFYTKYSNTVASTDSHYTLVSYDVMSVMSVVFEVFFLRRCVQAVLCYIRRREVSYDVMSVVQVVM